jgi:glycopeptide antibiotics resistance protein
VTGKGSGIICSVRPNDLSLSQPIVIVWLIPALLATIGLIATRRSRRATREQTLNVVRVLAVAYLGAAAFLTLWPFHPDVSVARVESGNWVPFHGMLGFLVSDSDLQNRIATRDVLANVLLFVPLGLLLPFAAVRWHPFVVTALLLVVFAFGLEITQGVAIAARTFDIDDAISGFAGGVGGMLAAGVLWPIASHR